MASLIENLLKNYWSQIALILGIVGYIIKVIFENYLKAKEIKYSHSHSAILNDAKTLYATFEYFNYRISQLCYMEISKSEIEAASVKLEEDLMKLYKDIFSLKIILDENEGKFLDDIQKKMTQHYAILIISLLVKLEKKDLIPPGYGIDKLIEFHKDEYPSYKLEFERKLRMLISK